ncbi:MAG: serine/threonine-protein kinase, partial [Acidobacteriia bacterium]|nr:serine/threonine-protein kinase [Terriglobia bacterium]
MGELNPQDWAEVERLFRSAVELSPDEQADFLARECHNSHLRHEVASLLEHFGHGLSSADDAIQAAASALAEGSDPDSRLIGARLGPYKLQAIVGHGGMGAVYRASRDDAEFQQQVAIKLIRVAAESPASLRRFRQERQILAQLSHPNIARLLDGGSSPEGVPYLVMEFIEGERITDWCQRQSLTEAARLRLFLQVCEAVEFAHRERVIHRDLKPANILVTADGTPKLLDFGIAKLLDPGAVMEPATRTGLHLMTPDYASPEQVRGAPAAPSMDVYALGLILYELLTGKKAQAISDSTPNAIVTAICDREPTAPAVLNPQLAGDLDTIIRMAIRKEPERRYASVAELAHDIQRHLEGRPVVAHPDTLTYRSAKFLRRHRVSATVGALLIASMIVGLAIESWLRPRSPRVSQVVQLTQTGSVNVGLGMVTDGSRLYFTHRSLGRLSLAQVPVNGGIPQSINVTPSLSIPDIFGISPDHSQLLVANGEGANRAVWIVPIRGGSARRVGDIRVRAAAWSPDGKRIVFATRSALFRMNALGTDSHKLAETPFEVAADSLQWAPAGAPDVLRFGMSDPKTQVRSIWQMASDGTDLRPLIKGWRNGAGWPEGDSSGCWFPSGSYFVFRSRRGKVSSMWALRDHRFSFPAFNAWPVQIYSSPLDFSRLAPSPDGKRIFFVARQERREFVRYDARRGQFMPYLSGIAGRSMDYSRDAQWAAYTSVPDSILWRIRPDGSERTQLTSAPLRVFWPRWSPDGTRIAFDGIRPGEPIRVCVIAV